MYFVGGERFRVPDSLLLRSCNSSNDATLAQDASEAFDTTFELSDTLYATGIIDAVDQVYVWLGVRLSI